MRTPRGRPAPAPGEAAPGLTAAHAARLHALIFALSGAATVQDVADALFAHGLQALGAAAGSIALRTPEGDALVVRAAVGYAEATLQRWGRFGLEAPVPLATVVRTGEAVWMPTIGDIRAHSPAIYAADATPRAAAALPLVVEGKVIGGIGLTFTGERPFPPEDREFFLTLARVCAQALERARLYEEERQAHAHARALAARLQTLTEATDAFAAASRELPVLLETVASHVTRHLEAACSICLLSEDGRQLTQAILRHVDPEAQRALDAAAAVTSIRVGEGIVGRVAAFGESVLVPEVSQEALLAAAHPAFRPLALRFPVHSFVVVPLKVQGRTLGTLQASRHVPGRPLVPEDQALLEELATRAALAIENARLLAVHQRGEQRLRDAVAAADVGTWWEDLASGQETRDASLNRILGLPAVETTQPSEDFLNRVHSEDRPLVEARFEAALTSGRPFEAEFRLVRPDGTVRWVRDRGQAFPGPDGGPGHMTGAVADITERKEAQEQQHFLSEAGALLSSSLEYHTVLQRLAQLTVPRLADWCAVDLLGEGGRVERVAAVHRHPEKVALAFDFARRWPISPSEHGGIGEVLRTGRPLFLPDIPDAALPAMARSPEHLEVGRTLGFRSALSVPLEARGRVLGALTLVAAESGRRFTPADLQLVQELARRASLSIDSALLFEEMREAEERLRFLSEASAALATSLDSAATLGGLVRAAVPRFADWFTVYVRGEDGRPHQVAAHHRDARMEQVLRDFHQHHPLAPEAPHGFPKVLRTGRTELLARFTQADLEASAPAPGQRELVRQLDIASVLTVPLAADGRTFGALMMGRTTGRAHFREAEVPVAEELARRVSAALVNARLFELAQAERQRAEEANRLKDEFLATISHELRTPLTSVLGWVQMLRAGVLATPEKQARALETIERNARVQTQLVEDLLDVSRILSGKMRLEVAPLELAEVVRAAVDSVRPAADARGLELLLELEGEALPFVGDAQRLQQVAWNLLSNAVKFTPAGGHVYVRLRRSDAWVELEVRDTGQGIPPDFLPHVFERFRQADSTSTRRHGGLGLGLSIVKHLVELHGGTVEAASAGEDQGACFTVRLPLAPPRSAPAPEGPAPLGALGLPPGLEGLRVLVVDDEPDVRELLSALLERCGVQVRLAGSAAEALAQLRQEPPDVLLCDIGMPDEDGYALLEQVRRLSPEEGGRTPALAMTAYARAEDRARVLRAGFLAHLSKPLQPQTLLVALSRAGNLPSPPGRGTG